MVILEHNGDGAMDRVGAPDTAFGHRDWSYDFLITSIWSDPADSEKNIRCTREFWEAMQPVSTDGVYVNYPSDEGEDRVKAAYAVPASAFLCLKNGQTFAVNGIAQFISFVLKFGNLALCLSVVIDVEPIPPHFLVSCEGGSKGVPASVPSPSVKSSLPR